MQICKFDALMLGKTCRSIPGVSSDMETARSDNCNRGEGLHTASQSLPLHRQLGLVSKTCGLLSFLRLLAGWLPFAEMNIFCSVTCFPLVGLKRNLSLLEAFFSGGLNQMEEGVYFSSLAQRELTESDLFVSLVWSILGTGPNRLTFYSNELNMYQKPKHARRQVPGALVILVVSGH